MNAYFQKENTTLCLGELLGVKTPSLHQLLSFFSACVKAPEFISLFAGQEKWRGGHFQGKCHCENSQAIERNHKKGMKHKIYQWNSHLYDVIFKSSQFSIPFSF